MEKLEKQTFTVEMYILSFKQSNILSTFLYMSYCMFNYPTKKSDCMSCDISSQ